MTIEQLLIFAITVFVVSIIPGPSMLLALTHGVCFGVRRTIASALGNVSVTFVQSLISVVGLGAVLIASETAFQVIKWGGAAYLLYMGISIFRSAKSSPMITSGEIQTQETSLRKMFAQSALVTAANPKAIVFFTAVFPQFMNPGGGFFVQAITLTVVCAVIAFGCFMIYAVCGQKLVSLLSKSKISRNFKRAVGGTFIGSSVALALSHR